MTRKAVLGVLVPGLLLLHFFLHVGLSIGPAAPDFLSLALLLAAREVSMGWGGAIGFMFGLLEDAFSILAFGANTLAMTVIGILGTRTRELFVGDSFLFLFVYLGSGKLLRDLIHWVAQGGAMREPFLDTVLVNGGIGALYVAAWGLFLTFLIGRGREFR